MTNTYINQFNDQFIQLKTSALNELNQTINDDLQWLNDYSQKILYKRYSKFENKI